MKMPSSRLGSIGPAVLIVLSLRAVAAAESLPHHLWMEAETFGPLWGYNFPITALEKQPRGAWAVAGPGVAAAWTQGGESEWMSIAGRADEEQEVKVSREIEVPAAGRYVLWVRYADYREKEETFGVRVVQKPSGGSDGRGPGFRGAAPGVVERTFGKHSVVDEMDPTKLLWDWAFAWDHAEVELETGPARVEIFTNGPTQARRQVDCLCLTTDAGYRPHGREKPEFAAWRAMRETQRAGGAPVERFTAARGGAGGAREGEEFRRGAGATGAPPPPKFLWNVGRQWAAELQKPAGARVEEPFGVDEPLLNDFLAAHAKQAPLIYGEKLSGPVWHIPEYPSAFATGSPAVEWLEKHPGRPFALLLNYGTPRWPKDADRAAVYANLRKYEDRLQGYIAGESLAHAAYDNAALEARVRGAKTRAEVLAALRVVHTESVVKKFSEMYGREVSAEEAWAPVVPCLSASLEAYAHALCAWGVRRIGHENTANSPALARRLAFLRGAARQFGRQMVDYQSCNFGDSATMYSRQLFFYPASSRYVLDNSYDAFAGAGMNWLWKDYVLWHLAGVTAFYNEQGIDLFWKPGGGSAGDAAPVQLSPKGKVAQAALRLAQEHPRGVQYTPVAFLLDEAHGWAQERFQPGAFGLDPSWNPAVLAPGAHEASIRGWFDAAYWPAPLTQNEPASAVRQTYVNGIFGDIFDVLVTAPGRTEALRDYPVVIVAGEVSATEEWSRALSAHAETATIVTCGHYSSEREKTGTEFTWLPTGQHVQTQAFRYRPMRVGSEHRALAVTSTGDVIATLEVSQVKPGRRVNIGIPLGLGLDEQPLPLLGLMLRHLVEGLMPVRVRGDVEWTLNRLEDGSWLVALLNNSGAEKPPHGILPTRAEEERRVRIEAQFEVKEGEEWMAGGVVKWDGRSAEVTVPAGAVRMVRVVGK